MSARDQSVSDSGLSSTEITEFATRCVRIWARVFRLRCSASALVSESSLEPLKPWVLIQPHGHSLQSIPTVAKGWLKVYNTKWKKSQISVSIMFFNCFQDRFAYKQTLRKYLMMSKFSDKNHLYLLLSMCIIYYIYIYMWIICVNLCIYIYTHELKHPYRNTMYSLVTYVYRHSSTLLYLWI